MINTVFVFGDSFGSYPPNDPVDPYWMTLIAKNFNAKLYQGGIIGASQDYLFSNIDKHKDIITEDDQIIIALTDPYRFWYVEHSPEVTNISILNIEDYMPPGVGKAALDFVKYIFRPNLAINWSVFRLGWLNNLSKVKKWQKPIIIKCFDWEINNFELYDHLNFADGCLYNISVKEYSKAILENIKIDPVSEIWRGFDPRGCHFTFSNHKILADKIINSITKNSRIDLNTDFLQEILTTESIINADFIKNEFSPCMYTKHQENQKRYTKESYVDLVINNFKKLR